jgi:23S rRNA (guanosine2251-2'-O)-methyltransferase
MKSEWIYGLHAVRAALENKQRKCLRLVATVDGAKKLGKLNNHSIESINKDALTKLLPKGAVHQGVACIVSALQNMNWHEWLNVVEDKDSAVVVVLDQVTDPHNIGAIIRSAAAFGADAVIVPEKGTPEITAVVSKIAVGALEVVPLLRVTNLVRALDELKKMGFWCIGFDEDGETSLPDYNFDEKTALIMGAEGPGLRRLTREACDVMLSLPTVPPIGSLNVSNAAAVALYEARKQKNVFKV